MSEGINGARTDTVDVLIVEDEDVGKDEVMQLPGAVHELVRRP